MKKVTTIRKEDEASENQEELNNVTRIVGKGYNFVAISTKYHYTGNTNPDGTPEYVYDRNRRVYTWGDASSSQLGTGSFMPYADPSINPGVILGQTSTYYSNVPVEVTMNPDDSQFNVADEDTGEPSIYLHNIANVSIGYYETEDGQSKTHIMAIDRKHNAFLHGVAMNTVNLESAV